MIKYFIDDYVIYLETRIKELKSDLNLYYNRLRTIREEYLNLILSKINDKPDRTRINSNVEFLVTRFRNVEREENAPISEILKSKD